MSLASVAIDAIMRTMTDALTQKFSAVSSNFVGGMTQFSYQHDSG